MKLTGLSRQCCAEADDAATNSASSRRCSRRARVPGAHDAKELNGWWWNGNSLSGQLGKTEPASVSGSVQAVSEFVQPGPFTSPLAFDQPPEYHAQSTPRSLRRSPIVGSVCGGSCVLFGANGWNGGWIVFTAKSPHARPAGCGESHATVSAPSRTVRVGW